MTNPVEAAVTPLKVEAIARAEVDALAYVERVRAALVEAGNDLGVMAPNPNSRTMSHDAYKTAASHRQRVKMLVKHRAGSRRPSDPNFVDIHPEYVARFVDACKASAAAQYDAFVAKLCAKIGEVEAAELAGNHIWGFSVLTITRADGSREAWKTQQIVNVSKLGLLFNQWPSRKIKGGK